MSGKVAVSSRGVRISGEVSDALARRSPVVALESALITHGFAPPANLQISDRITAAVRGEGAVPAVCAVLDGQAHVGASREEIERLATSTDVAKLSLRDLPIAAARGLTGGTTVAASVHLAHYGGIGVLATGGIGGVHRGHPEDVSADLPTLAATPVVVVCSGAKSVLDLPRTLEYLETHGVPVLGYGTEEFPAFYSRRSGLPVDVRVDTPLEVADIVAARKDLALRGAILVCVPVPAEYEVPSDEASAFVAEAVEAADDEGVAGSELTPFLLLRLAERSLGRTSRANKELLVSNARVASKIARAIALTG